MSASSSRLRVLVSNVVPFRAGGEKYTRLLERLSAQVVAAMPAGWGAIEEFAGEEGVDATCDRLDDVDMVVITGGDDLAPGFYGGRDGYEGEGAHYPEADTAQIELVRAAMRRGIPVLGICRGMQLINVACGGTLVQHMRIPGHRLPDVVETGVFARHDVSIAVGSVAAEVYGRRAEIHSSHHQAVDIVGHGLRTTAYADDGTVEAIEGVDAPVLGMQWHPEAFAADLSLLTQALESLAARGRSGAGFDVLVSGVYPAAPVAFSPVGAAPVPAPAPAPMPASAPAPMRRGA